VSGVFLGVGETLLFASLLTKIRSPKYFCPLRVALNIENIAYDWILYKKFQ